MTARCATTSASPPSGPCGKNFDATGAFGPEIVTPDELPEGAQGLQIASRLNGQTLQDGNTRDMIFSVARTIAILSEVMTLEPGDVIIDRHASRASATRASRQFS